MALLGALEEASFQTSPLVDGTPATQRNGFLQIGCSCGGQKRTLASTIQERPLSPSG